MPIYDFVCPKCGKTKDNIILSLKEHSRLEKVPELICRCNGKKNVMKQVYNDAPGIVTMTKSRVSSDMSTKKKIKEDRRKRATEHFKKEVLPTINKKDAAHFKKKYNIKS